MRVLPFKIQNSEKSTFKLQEDHQPYFYDHLHNHPEYQLMCIEAGSGTVICDQYLGEFNPGDLFFIGPNVPHVFKSAQVHYGNKAPKSHALSVFFGADLADIIQRIPEWKRLQELLEKSKQGLQFRNQINLFRTTYDRLSRGDSGSNIVELLDLLNRLVSEEHTSLNTSSQKQVTDKEGNRMDRIYQYIFDNYQREIKLAEVASIAALSEASFCRHFKKRTRKTFVTFLNEVRIAEAKRKLQHSNETIAAISVKVGFENLSYFNRIFKKATGLTPSEFRRLSTSTT